MPQSRTIQNLKFILFPYDVRNANLQMAPTEILLYSLIFTHLSVWTLFVIISVKYYLGNISSCKIKDQGGPEILSSLCPCVVAISLLKHRSQAYIYSILKHSLKEILNFPLWETQLSIQQFHDLENTHCTELKSMSLQCLILFLVPPSHGQRTAAVVTLVDRSPPVQT